ncbi:MAG: hypothetical protein QNK33_03450 [Bacteroidales bacterium]|nr:hypothetical protein [Bacteroidales bacterium]
MVKRFSIILSMLLLVSTTVHSQRLIKAENLVNSESDPGSGRIIIDQDLAIDTLLTRHINANRIYGGYDGFRIQIYSGSTRAAREESNEAISKFISEFPEIKYELKFELPNFFKVRVGNYRTRRDAIEDFYKIKKKFPNAYPVPDIIKFSDLDI